MKRPLGERIKGQLLTSLWSTSFALVFSLSLLVVGTTLFQGRTRLSLDFLRLPTSAIAYEGGVRYQILGTLVLITTTALAVTPFAVAVALFSTQFSKGMGRRVLDTLLQLLNATPSVLYGVLGFVFFFKFLGWEKSWLAGGLILATMVLPTVSIALVERIQTIPEMYLQVGRGLGFNDDQLIWKVVLPYAWGGLLTGLVLGISRAAGETAPILFTAAVMSGAEFPAGVKDNPILALPYHVFNLAQDVYGEGAMQSAWSTAAVLLFVSLFFSLLAVPLRARSHEEAKAP